MFQLNYTGDVSEAVGRVMGPDGGGALYEVVDSDYSKTLNWTRLFLKPVLPSDQRSIYPGPDGPRVLEEK